MKVKALREALANVPDDANVVMMHTNTLGTVWANVGSVDVLDSVFDDSTAFVLVVDNSRMIREPNG